MKYNILLKINAPRSGTARKKVETWLGSHMEEMLSERIGCFNPASEMLKSITIVLEKFQEKKDLLVTYELRDSGAYKRYEREFAKEMRQDPNRPKCIQVIARWISD